MSNIFSSFSTSRPFLCTVGDLFILSIKRQKTFLSSFIEFLFPLPGLLRAETRVRVQVNGLARLHPELK